jgi:hypothetical protein
VCSSRRGRRRSADRLTASGRPEGRGDHRRRATAAGRRAPRSQPALPRPCRRSQPDHRRGGPTAPRLRRARHGDDALPAEEEEGRGLCRLRGGRAWGARHAYPPALLFVATTESFAVEPRWFIDEKDGEALDLLGALREARRPLRRGTAPSRGSRREDDEERRRLRRDPDALRSHLRRRRDRGWGLENIRRPAAIAIAPAESPGTFEVKIEQVD